MTKIQLQLSKSGVFLPKKMFRKYLETFVIISLQGGDSRYFSRKSRKLCKVDKNQTSSFKIGGKEKKKEKEREN